MHIAITGNIGSGKSTVSEILRSLGYVVQDADTIAKQCLESSDIKKKLLKHYGSRILTCEGHIDTKYLAAQIFNHPQEKQLIESWIHPLVYKILNQSHHQQEIIFSEVPLLYESQGQTNFDQVWLIVSDEALMRERTKQHRAYSDEEFERRLKHQIPQSQKIEWADLVIENTIDLETLKSLVIQALEKVKSQYEHPG
jgi:dephospho-CoA kinase